MIEYVVRSNRESCMFIMYLTNMVGMLGEYNHYEYDYRGVMCGICISSGSVKRIEYNLGGACLKDIARNAYMPGAKTERISFSGSASVFNICALSTDDRYGITRMMGRIIKESKIEIGDYHALGMCSCGRRSHTGVVWRTRHNYVMKSVFDAVAIELFIESEQTYPCTVDFGYTFAEQGATP